MAATLTSLPEEILERILAYALAPGSAASEVQPALLKSSFTRSHSTPFAVNHRPSSSRPTDFKSFSRAPVYRYSPLLTCTVFARIGTALLLSELHVKSREQCTEVMRMLQQRPDLARCVKALRLDGIWGDSKMLVRALQVPGGRLEDFDFCIADPEHGLPGLDECALQVFCETLAALPAVGSIKHLRVRKASDAYLTLPTPNRILEVLGKTIPQWKTLETVNIAFRLPSGPRTSSPSAPAPSNTAMFGVTQFVLALAQAPSLKSVHAELPAVWNTALLEISTNPSLDAITLTPAPPVAGGHIFLAEARKHPRLAELIENGTPVPTLVDRVGRAMGRVPVGTQGRSSSHGRMRAHTTVAATSSASNCDLTFPGTSSSLSPSSYPKGSTSTASSASSGGGAGSSSRPRRVSHRPSVTRRAPKGNRRMSAV